VGDTAGVAQISPEGITGLDDEMEVQLLGAGQEVRLPLLPLSRSPASLTLVSLDTVPGRSVMLRHQVQGPYHRL